MQVVRVSPTYDGFSYRTLAAACRARIRREARHRPAERPGSYGTGERESVIVQSFHITGKR